MLLDTITTKKGNRLGIDSLFFVFVFVFIIRFCFSFSFLFFYSRIEGRIQDRGQDPGSRAGSEFNSCYKTDSIHVIKQPETCYIMTGTKCAKMLRMSQDSLLTPCTID
jgi:hypothetical protein